MEVLVEVEEVVGEAVVVELWGRVCAGEVERRVATVRRPVIGGERVGQGGEGATGEGVVADGVDRLGGNRREKGGYQEEDENNIVHEINDRPGVSNIFPGNDGLWEGR